MSHIELGTFSFEYNSSGVHGMGLSSSSNFAVLYEACQLYFKNGPLLAPKEVAQAALRFERHLAEGKALAAQDVYGIAFGGVSLVNTEPNKLQKGRTVDGAITVEPIAHDPRFIAEHVVVAFNPVGKRHDVPGLLECLFEHPKRTGFVQKMSGMAKEAARAIRKQNIRVLANVVKSYRDEFDDWSGIDPAKKRPRYTSNIIEVADEMISDVGVKGVEWKPPGGGASQSIIVIAPDQHARDKVIRFFESKEWWAKPAYVTSGIYGEFLKANGDVRITAGHRLDFVGAADLGQDILIGQSGCCCNCAIEPRTEIRISTTPAHAV